MTGNEGDGEILQTQPRSEGSSGKGSDGDDSALEKHAFR